MNKLPIIMFIEFLLMRMTKTTHIYLIQREDAEVFSHILMMIFQNSFYFDEKVLTIISEKENKCLCQQFSRTILKKKKWKNILNSYFPQAPPLHVSQARSVTSRAARPRGQVRTHFAWRRPLPWGAGDLFLTTGLFHWLIMTTSAAAPRACVEAPLFVNNLSFAE